jgi:protein gp37
MNKTKISWTDFSWSSVTGCSPIGAGCDHCWANSLHSMRHKAHLNGKKMAAQYEVTFSTIQLHPSRLEDPFRLRESSKIATCLGGDLFHEKIQNEFIAAVFAIAAACPHLTFQMLTKRPGRMVEWFKWVGSRSQMLMHESAKQYMGYENKKRPAINTEVWPLPNVWMGVSVWDQPSADEFIPILLNTPAAIRWVSYEPALGPLGLSKYLSIPQFDCPIATDHERCGLDWVVCGGESGKNARRCDVQWIRSIVDQCKDAEVPVFVKQMGDYSTRVDPTDDVRGPVTKRILWQKRAGSDPAEWPVDLQVRQFPIP